MTEETQTKVLALWTEFCQDVSELQKDVEKNTLKQNVSAGIRFRKGLRAVRKHLTGLLQESLKSDKEVISTRKTENTSSKNTQK